jgi:predicted metal-dependent HD superfamily phosphohydrolase
MTILNPPTPGRPDHPDFKRLDDAVKTQDMRANLGRQLPQQLAAIYDTESVIYMSDQCIQACLEMLAGMDLGIVFGALWMDGFMVANIAKERELKAHDKMRELVANPTSWSSNDAEHDLLVELAGLLGVEIPEEDDDG